MILDAPCEAPILKTLNPTLKLAPFPAAADCRVTQMLSSVSLVVGNYVMITYE